jgi:hypothetical protein
MDFPDAPVLRPSNAVNLTLQCTMYTLALDSGIAKTCMQGTESCYLLPVCGHAVLDC